MVWGFFPVNKLSGDEKYYIFAKGTYKVGRKGCDLTIGNDKSISRIHAEIVVDAMESLGPIEDRSSSFNSKVRLRDCSKYGTFFERNGMKKKILDCPGKEICLRDGDLVTFGTGNVIYRYSFVPLIFYLCNFTSSQETPTQDKISSIGACFANSLTLECTHAIVDPFMPVTKEIIDVILSKKPLVQSTWLEYLAATRIHNEIPSCSQYMPTLTLDGGSVTVSDTRTRETSLKGYTFVLGSVNLYRFRDRVQSLLEVAGAMVLSAEEFDSNSQDLVEIYKFPVLVIPADSAEGFCQNSSLSKIKETHLISAVISGSLDPSFLISPSIVVSSSCSTVETVVAESDAETETATSNHQTTTNVVVGDAVDESKRQALKEHVYSLSEDTPGADLMQQSYTEAIRGQDNYKIKLDISKDHNASHGDVKAVNFLEPKREAATGKNDVLESPNLDILYSKKLIVKATNVRASTHTLTDGGVINFKRFRKTSTQSGNSFINLVPFSKHAYCDSDYDKEVTEYVKEEKKRKQMEAMADDLFNNERGRRRGVAGSLHGLLSHN